MTTAKTVNTPDELACVLGQISLSKTIPPHLYVDLEGVNLSRNGTISILTLYDRSQPYVYLIDILTLGAKAFTTPSANSSDAESDFMALDTPTTSPAVTLKTILEAPDIPKVFFDVRNDSDALCHHFGIHMQGVQDLQVMELATRCGRSRDHVNGLARCIQFGLAGLLTPLQRSQVQGVKTLAAKMFQSGSYEVFNERPLDNLLQHYCMQDVVHMPALWNVYNSKLRVRFWKHVVDHETQKRLEESRSPDYIPQGFHKSLGWEWDYLCHLELVWRK